MALVATAATPGKAMTLSELRVFELKLELEKRGLDKSGIKLALVERLEVALREEGHDPKTYKFMVTDYKCSSSSTKSSCETVKDGSLEYTSEAINGDHRSVQQETKKNDESENAPSEIVLYCESKDEENESSGALTRIRESSEEIMEGINFKRDDADKTMSLKKERREKTDEVEQMEVNEAVVEETKRIGESDEKKDPEEAVKEVGEEVSYEDEELSEETKTTEGDFENRKNRDTGVGLTVKIDDDKLATERVEEGEVKKIKEGDGVFTSSAETVASTPAERVESSSHLASSVLRKADNSLWIRGISPNTKAADLKALFAKYGRVLTAKIFTRRQQPSNACFGFVTMVDATAADLCIQKLHKTTLKGRAITVERADRCNMPTVKSIPKRSGSNSTGDAKSGKSMCAVDTSSKSIDDKKSCTVTKASEKSKKDTSTEKSKTSTSNSDKVGSAAGSDKQKTMKATDTKKSPVKAPSASTTHSKFSSYSSGKHTTSTRPPQRFRIGRRIERVSRVSSTLRGSYPIRKLSFSSAASRRTLGNRQYSSRFVRGSISRTVGRREVSSRRVEPPTSWEKREVMEMLRKKEEEHRLKEQELRLQRERERLKFERERFERERLELQQLRQIAALATPMQSMMPAPAAPPPRRSHEFGDMDSSRYKSEKKLKRNEYARRSGERSSSHRITSSRSSLSDRREPHTSSRHVNSTHSSSRVASERSRERSRDRSRHGAREYGASSVIRESISSYGRESHSYSRTGDSALSSSYGRDLYRPDSTTYSSHRASDSAYGNRDLGTYSSSSTYSRDVAPSSYAKDAGYVGSSRSLGGGASWSVGSSSAYVGSRDYDNGAWMSSMSTSQSHGSHGLGSSSWSPSRDDHWSGSSVAADTHSHVSSYDKYDKYDSYDKYSRRY